VFLLPKRAVRISQELDQRMQRAVRDRGFRTPSAFLRAAIENELSGRAELTGAEERIAAGFERITREMFRMGRGQQALFALVDALTKTFLTCVPEPPAEATQQAVARAKSRYARLMQNAGGAMVGESRAAMQDLVGHVSEE
jgi:Arc/MetJ-type ribon-helix-helix transcriptional regulator